MRRCSLFTLLFLLGVVIVPTSVHAQKARLYQYVVKFVCGQGDGKILAKGVYLTAINVHNPTDTLVVFKKKIAVALPSEKPGPVSKVFEASLEADQALEIDCQDISKHVLPLPPLPMPPKPLKGFVIIESKVMLDVVAVYTVADPKGEAVQAMDVEYVAPH
jgi:hypothetical protein